MYLGGSGLFRADNLYIKGSGSGRYYYYYYYLDNVYVYFHPLSLIHLVLSMFLFG